MFDNGPGGPQGGDLLFIKFDTTGDTCARDQIPSHTTQSVTPNVQSISPTIQSFTPSSSHADTPTVIDVTTDFNNDFNTVCSG